ncbi:MAG: helix-turn-helix domain-containing protein [Propionibacteriaceae bacterium]|jgi:transcriptional regulator with XRE-family HTH domain|nr:helix-turn-helix domain-containing protein [Propionibacteriaceae bacterium]
MVISSAADLGAVLKQGRQAKGMTQQQLAQMLGVTRQWVASVESGAPTARLGLAIDALRCVDILLDTRQDDSGAILSQLFGGLP